MTELKPCPFCGSSDIDPEGCASFKQEYKHDTTLTWDKDATSDKIEHRPACNNCNATTDGDWNVRADLAERDGWKKIESFPKGTAEGRKSFLGGSSGWVGECYYDDGQGQFYLEGTHHTNAVDGSVDFLTHWRELPPPPADEAEDG